MNVPITELIVIVLLTLLEAFFVAAEIALVSIRRSRVDQLVEEDRPGARRVRRLLDEPGRFLAVSQLGLTVIGFFASAFAAVNLANQMTGLLAGWGMDPGTAEGISLIAVTVVWGIFAGPPSQRELVEWDLLMNEAEFEFGDADADDSVMDIENIAVHELGHAAGLGHPSNSCTEETMYAYADFGETKKRTLEAGDMAGILALY